MKKIINKISLVLIASLIMYSCNDQDLNVVDNSAGFSTGGLVRNDSKLVNYVIGSNADYTFDVLVYQGDVTTTSIDVMKSFTTASGDKSNEVLLKNIPITSSTASSITISTNFTELIEGLTVNGSPISSNDADLVIADFWSLTYVANTSEGKSHKNGETSKLAVSTRLAGTYDITFGRYRHPVGEQGPLTGGTRIIESVANEPAFATYLATDIGPWVDDTNYFYFYVSNTPNAAGNYDITIPKEYKGNVQLIWGADEIAICSAGEVPDMACDMYAVFNADGHDNLFYSYGYIRTSGTRQFQENLTKQ
jgi:hypothetical protein